MENEREIFLKTVVEKLRKKFADRLLTFHIIDLRWGIKPQEDENNHTLYLCLNAIKRADKYSEVFFISTIGERYGWADFWQERNSHFQKIKNSSDFNFLISDENRGKIATELEILYGLSLIKKQNQALFYFREKSLSEQIHKNKKIEFDSPKKLQDLKIKIKNHELAQSSEYQSFDEFGNQIFNDLSEKIDSIYPKENTPNELEQAKIYHQIFAKSRQDFYIPIDEYTIKIEQFLNSKTQNRLLIYGKSGLGKSSLLSNIAKTQKEKNRKIIEFYVGSEPQSSATIEDILFRIIQQIRDIFKIEDELPEKSQAETYINLWLKKIPENQNLLILIDGLNQIDDQRAEQLFWIPIVSQNIKIIVSSIEKKSENPNFEFFQIDTLPKDKISDFIDKYLLPFEKKFSQETKDLILSSDAIQTPIYLISLLNELRLYGNFDNLEDQIKTYLEAETPVKLFKKIISRVESDFENFGLNKKSIQDILSLIYISRDGVSEERIKSFFPKIREIELENLLIAFDSHLIYKDGRLQFFHQNIKEAVKEFYLSDFEIEQKYRNDFANFLIEIEKRDREKREDILKIDFNLAYDVVYQFYTAKNSNQLLNIMLDIPYFLIIVDHIKIHLIEFVEKAEKSDFAKELKNNLFKFLDSVSEDLNKASILNSIGIFLSNKKPKYKEAEELLLKVIQIEEKVVGFEHSDTATSYHNLGLLYYEQNRLKEAEKLYLKALKIREKIFGFEHFDTATSYYNLGVVYQKQNRLEEAEDLYLKAIKIREKIFGFEHSDTATSYSNLANLYSEQEKLEKAEELHLKAIKIREKIFGFEHSDTANSYNNLGLLYSKQNRLKEAEKLFLKAIKIFEKIFGFEHFDTATSYYNLGVVYQKQNRLKEAEELHLKALKIREKIFGFEHFHTAASYSSLSGLCNKQNKLKEAEELDLKALKIREKIFGFEYSETAISYNYLALLYEKQDRLEEAEDLYLKAIKIREKIFGFEHPKTATSYSNLANLYSEQEKLEKAEELHLKAIKIREKIFGFEHSDTANSYNNLGLLYSKQNRLKEAEKLFLKAIKIFEKIFGFEHPKTATSYNNLGFLYEKQNRLKEAEELFLKALKIREKIFGFYHSDTAHSYHNLGFLYNEQNRLKEAEKLYLKALKIFEKVLGFDHSDTASSYNNLSVFYHKQRKFEKALFYQEKALEIRKKVLGLNHSDTQQSIKDNQMLKNEIAKQQNQQKNSEKIYGLDWCS
jgi:tetratricopeptide (TPR) repeat protein/energy-coupling factor transporter ATP-binding protein EcfA2